MKERAEGEKGIEVPDCGGMTEGERFLESVRIGMEQAERGEFIEEAEMDARVERMLQSGRPR